MTGRRSEFGPQSQFSSVVEQQFCKLRVVGSNPTTGSILRHEGRLYPDLLWGLRLLRLCGRKLWPRRH